MAAKVIESPGQKEAVLAEVAKLHRRGYTFNEMAVKLEPLLGRVVTSGAINVYVKEVKKRYLETQLEEREASVMETLAILREVRKEAWEAWERSKEDMNRTTKRSTPKAVEEDEEEEGSSKGVKGKKKRTTKRLDVRDRARELMMVELTEMVEGRLPANAYLNTILETVAQERELLGLDEVTRVEVKGAVLTVPWEQLYGPIDGPRPSDAIERKIEQAALPAAEPQENGP